MSPRRKKIPLSTQLAACLAELQYLRGDPFRYDDLRKMTPGMLLSLYEVDHSTLYCLTQDDHFCNLTLRLIPDHRAKTKRDVAQVAKGRRIARKHAQHLTAMAAKINGHIDSRGMLPVDVRGHKDDGYPSRPAEKPKRKWPSRKIPSRPFPKRERRPC